ncbi:MAG: PP2C family protein-serine/threonine phosphatase [Oscillatoriales cyanobacterium SM2_1_8]|nr:PP2C family protein-serine/threonine phosphatase [Oscillatoriales cyanobacterium SM2_1_8]
MIQPLLFNRVFNRVAALPPDWRKAFRREVAHANYRRARIIAMFTCAVTPFAILGVPTLPLDAANALLLTGNYSVHLLSSFLFLANSGGLTTHGLTTFLPRHQRWAQFYRAAFLVFLNFLFLAVWRGLGMPTPYIAGVILFYSLFLSERGPSLVLIVCNFVYYVLAVAWGMSPLATPEDSARYQVLALSSGGFATGLAWAMAHINWESRLSSFLARRELAEANAEIATLNVELHSENRRLAVEVNVAKRLQAMLLPKTQELQAIAGLDVAYFAEPADEVGGDYCEVLACENGLVKLGIGDVTGHGLESGVLMLMVQTAVRTLTEAGETDPIRFLDVLNRTLFDNMQRIGTDRNLTLALLDYELKGAVGHIRIFGQHEEAIVVRANGTIEHIDTDDLGLPIALDRDIAPFANWFDFELVAGDVLVLYTDGIPEAENPDGVFYGLERLCQVVQSQSHGSAQTICAEAIADVKKFISTQRVLDDITLIVAKQR